MQSARTDTIGYTIKPCFLKTFSGMEHFRMFRLLTVHHAENDTTRVCTIPNGQKRHFTQLRTKIGD